MMAITDSTARAWIPRAALALTAAALVPVSWAQDNPARGAAAGVGLEEIVVSARKREEALLDVPIAITAFTAEQIEKAQIFDLRDLTVLAPGMTFQAVGGNGPGGRYNSNLIFRGMTNSAPLPRQQTGAVFVDGVYVLGGVASVNTVDVERIEVLKGPQNAYFGRNTFGGAVNFVTRNPGSEFKGAVAADFDEWGSNNLSMSVEGPLVGEKVSGRLSVLRFDRAGQYEANDGGTLGDESTISVTGTLFAQPSDNFFARLRVHYQEDDDGAPNTVQLSGGLHGNSCAGRTYSGRNNDGTPRTFAVSLPYFCSGIPTISDLGERNIVSSNTTLASPLLASAGAPNALVNAFVNNSLNDPVLARAPRLDRIGMYREVLRLSGQAEYEFGNGITAALNLGFNKNDTMAITDPDRADVENVFTAAPALFEDRTLELRFTSAQDQRLRWLVGANYYKGDFVANTNGSVIWQIPTVRPMAPPFFPTAAVRNTPANRDGENAVVQAVFGSVDFDITDTLTATAELRYQEDETVLGEPVDPGGIQPMKAVFTDTMPRAILKWQPTQATNLYFSWSKGVLPGQFNAQYINAPAFQRAQIEAAFPGVSETAPSQEIESLELGLKQRLFNDRLEYSVAVYDMDWTSMLSGSALVVQTSATNPAPLILTGVLIPGDSRLRGIEFEGTALITDNWDVNLRLDLMDTEYVTFFQPFVAQLTSQTSRFDGNTLPRVPQRSASIASTYRGRVNSDWGWFVRGDVNYTGKAWDSEANIVQTDDFTRVNLRIGFERENLSVELYARNLFDNDNWDYGFRSVSFREPGGQQFVPIPAAALPPGAPPTFGFQQGMIVQPPDKRAVGLRVKYDF
jgi:iron complex outermembrane receptor protein